MKEVLNLQIGRCGNSVGVQFWELVCREHGLDFSGTYRGSNHEIQLGSISSYFREVRGMRYVPRSIMVDLDRDSMDIVKSSAFSSIFRHDNLAYGRSGTGNNWAKGHLTEGAQLMESVLDVTRREAENTDCLQAFQIIHSIGGGTGSGLGALIMDSVKDEYPGRNVSTFTVVPSPNRPQSGMEIYNSVLSMSHLIIESDGSYLMDNHALNKICSENSQLCTNQDLNSIMASAISGITTCMRFHCDPNVDFRKISINFVPYPRLHFFAPSFAPITFTSQTKHRYTTQREVMDQLFSKRLFVDGNSRQGKFLSLAVIFKGNVCPSEVMKRFNDFQHRNSWRFVEWIPDNAKAFTCELPSQISQLSAAMVANTTAIQQMLERLKEEFVELYKRKAFLVSYTSEGLDEMELEEALTNINDVMDEYRQSQVKTAGIE